MNEIKVQVCYYRDRKNLVLRFVDPLTGKRKTKSAETASEAEAIRRAAVWEEELRSGRYLPPSKLTWEEFRRRFEREKLAACPASTRAAYRSALEIFERLAAPERMAKLDGQTMSRFQADARARGMKATTLARHLRHVKAMLRWGERIGMIAKAPAIEMPKLPKGQSLAKHRPPTAEEFDRMMMAVAKVRPNDAAQWERLLRGLWLSGLRLGEAVALDWNDGPFVLDTLGKHPAFRIEAVGQKSRRSELAPVAPDFAEWIIAETAEIERVGKVFLLVDDRGRPFKQAKASGIIVAIGRAAGVVVGDSEKAKLVDGRLVRHTVKMFAGAHDLRRAFCTRWARKVRTPVLQRLARHANIMTTMSYYVNLTADEIGDDLWTAHKADKTGQEVNSLGNSETASGENAGVSGVVNR